MITTRSLTQKILESSNVNVINGKYKSGSYEEKSFIQNKLSAAIKDLLKTNGVELHDHNPTASVDFRGEQILVAIDSFSLRIARKLGIE